MQRFTWAMLIASRGSKEMIEDYFEKEEGED